MTLASLGLCIAGACLPPPDPPPICIPAGALRERLVEFTGITGLQVLYDWTIMAGVPTPGVCHLALPPNQLLGVLLSQAPGFTWEWVNERTLAVFAIGPCEPELGARAPTPPCLPPALEIRP